MKMTKHEKAKRIFEKELLAGIFGKIFVADYVFDETMTFILNRIKKKSFTKKTNEFILNQRRYYCILLMIRY